MAGSETRFAVLFFTDIVGSTDLKTRHGVPAYRDALRTHNDHFERIVRECRGLRILQNMGDGYFAEGDSVAEVVKFALLFQDAMRAGPWREMPLATRVGIHAGEVSALIAEGGSGIVAPAADLAARVMSLAEGGQILLTRFPFDEARHFLREHPPIAGRTMPPLRWLAHGPYLLKGRDEPMDIFEVGADGLAPLTAPPDGEKARRAIRPGEEETLGWRPAVGLEIPGRTGWHLTAKLGAGGFGEVWEGEHAKLHQRRAFKFCFDEERLRALKREVTLVRLLRSALGDRDDIVHIHELKLDAPPFYLESDLAPHGNLLQWAERQGGLAKIPLAQRIALVAHTATALAAAHSIGVLHKDIKPTNILIFDAPDGTVRPRLVDFGIGTLADPGILAQQGVTAAGFTRMTIQHSTGTPTYSPPEYLAGRPYTIQGDIYGLGVLLYQLVTARPLDPLAPGWERDIPDPLLREDIATCVDGDPARRFPSAADLAERLLHLPARHQALADEAERSHVEEMARRTAEAERLLAEEKARREEAERLQHEAESARRRAQRLARTALILGAMTGAMVLACAGFVAHELTTSRAAMARHLQVLADMLARNSTALLTFKDADAAIDSLLALRADPSVGVACFYDAEGAPMATYARDGQRAGVPLNPEADGVRFGTDRLVVVQPVTFNDKRLGTLYLHANTEELTARLRAYAQLSALILLGSLLLALAFSSALHRIITRSRRTRLGNLVSGVRGDVTGVHPEKPTDARLASCSSGRESLRRRFKFALILGTTLIALLAAGAGFLIYERATFRAGMARNLEVLTDTLARNSAAALLFRDAETATDNLQALSADLSVEAACLYDAEGVPLATYGRGGQQAEVPPRPENLGTRFVNDRLVVVHPVVLNSNRIGTLHLRADLYELKTKLRDCARLSGLILLGSLIFAVAISYTIQWVITWSRRTRRGR